VYLVDLETRDLAPDDRVRFTFYWPEDGRWEGIDFDVCIE
jgi:hypothetical protein